MANISNITNTLVTDISRIYEINKINIAKIMGVNLRSPNTIDLYISNNNIDSDLTDFPLLINLSNSSGKGGHDLTEVFDTIGSDYTRLKIYDSNGLQLYTEVENWDVTNKTAQLWVKVPTISSSTSTHLVLDYSATSGNNDYISDDPVAKAINLSVDKGSEGTYDSHWSEECSVIKENDTSYKMWYSGWNGSSPYNYRIIYCTSTDGLNWSNFQMVMDINTEGTYDTQRVYRPCVIKENDTSYKMWYTGQDGSHFRILYATSTDGINWSNHQLVVDIGSEGTYDTTDTTDSYVIKESDISYKMWYVGWKAGHRRIIYCTSTDGINWSNFQMVIDKGSEGTYDTVNASAPRVIKESDTSYKMWYTGWNTSTHTRIIYCDSTDGINWSNFQMVLNYNSEGTYDTKHSRYSFVIKESDNLYKMWYDGWTEGSDTSKVRILYTTSEDGKVWTKNVVNRVWDDNFVGVWHMSQDPSGGANSIYDSTSNANHGTPKGSMTNSDLVDGKIGKAIDFDGTNDRIEVSNSTSLNPSEITISYLAKSNTTNWSNEGCHVSKRNVYIMHPRVSTKNFLFYIYDGGWHSTEFDSIPDITIWHNYIGKYDGSNIQLYIDGVSKSSTAYSGSINTSDTGHLLIGKDDGFGRYFNGLIDEVRISKIARSADWIKTTYYSNLDNLVTYDKEIYTLEINNSNINSDLNDFPLLINLSTSAGTNNYDLSNIFDTIGSDYNKLKIYDSNGLQLYTEVENWDATNKSAQLWVKVPTISSSSPTRLTLDYSAISGNNDYISDDPTAKAINLSVDKGSEGTYDSHWSEECSVIKENDTSYKMWYSGYDGSHYRIIYCTSTDGINWSNHQMVVNIGSEGTYDTVRAYRPCVIKESDTSYKMWYGGRTNSHERIIYCTSIDGINWSNFQMVINIGSQGTYDTQEVLTPYVIKESNTSYKMWYTGYDGSYYRILYCTSTDGINWSNHQLSVNYNSEGTYDTKNVAVASVIKEGDTLYKMWYIGRDGIHWRIIYCDSTDGVNWSNFEMVLNYNIEGTYDTLNVKYPFVIKESDNLYKMWYDGWSSSTEAKILYATSEDGKVWTKNVVNRVWDDDFVAVYHMSQDPSGGSDTIYDSTSNNNHGTPQGNMTSSDLVDGGIGKALDFDGSNDWINIGNIVCSPHYTLEAIFKTSAIGNYGYLLTSEHFSGNYVKPSLIFINGDQDFNFTTGFYKNPTWYWDISGITRKNDGVFHYAAGTYDKVNFRSYIDDLTHSTPSTTSVPTSTEDYRIGARWDAETQGGWWKGIIDEVRMSKIARSADWIKATYYSNWDNLNYWS